LIVSKIIRLREKIAERRKTIKLEKANSRIDKIEKHKQYLLDTNSLPIRQYLMDNLLPTVTEGLIKVTDKINFLELNDDNLDTFYPEDHDPMQDLIEYLEEKGKVWMEGVTKEATIKMEERKVKEAARKAAKEHSEEWDSNDDSAMGSFSNAEKQQH
jgi:hypothetical protein